MKIEISYMSGAGNLFTVINNEKYHFSAIDGSKLAPILCRKSVVNSFITEGLILVSKPLSENCDFSAVFYNPDGTCDAMCGNGGRCAVHFATVHGLNLQKYFCFSMAGSLYKYMIKDDLFSLYFPAPTAFKNNFLVQTEDNVFTGTYVDVGTRHFIIKADDYLEYKDFSKAEIVQTAKVIRYSKEFAPHGVNVNFYLIKDQTIFLRTYERGVEAETGACGTGTLSTAIALNSLKLIDFPVKVIPTSGIPLYVDKNNDREYILTGPAQVLNTISVDI